MDHGCDVRTVVLSCFIREAWGLLSTPLAGPIQIKLPFKDFMKSKIAVVVSCLYAAVVLFFSVFAGFQYSAYRAELRGEALFFDWLPATFLTLVVGAGLGLIATLFIGAMADMWKSPACKRCQR